MSQANLSVSSYFTQLKGPSDTLQNYSPMMICSYGTLKVLTDYHQWQYVLHFLMGRNNNFSNIRGKFYSWIPYPLLINFFSCFTRGRTTSSKSNDSVFFEFYCFALQNSVLYPIP